jgi:hypothetical protein
MKYSHVMSGIVVVLGSCQSGPKMVWKNQGNYQLRLREKPDGYDSETTKCSAFRLK